jgi:hypothetical protein
MKRTVSLLLVASLSALAAAPRAVGGVALESASMHIEFNDTEQIAQVIFTIDAGVELKWLNVFAPDGRRVARVSSNDRAGLGLTAFTIESAEPTLDELEQAYPEGIYRFRGRTVDGEKVYGRTTLSHALPSTPVITFPADGGTGLSDSGFAVTWDPVTGATGYVLELEQGDTDISLKIRLDKGATSFSIPTGWLVPNTQYTLSVASLDATGNWAVEDITFTTGG